MKGIVTESGIAYGFSCPQCRSKLPDYALSCDSCGTNLRGVELRTSHTLDNSINRKEQSIFFYVSPLKLILMTVSTFGIYQLFWFYKNWTYVDEHTNENHMPMISAIFGAITYYPLMSEISKAGAQAGEPKKLPALVLAPLFFILPVVSSFHPVLYPLGLGACLCLIPTQLYVNKLNSQSPTPRNDKLSPWNWVTIVIGGGFHFFQLLSHCMQMLPR